ncbi:ATP-binding cassette domain-containing protein [Streptomyces fumanus]|uniref:ABC transporter ATP-binding protein n=1 Tax=Streptomyces fumanus TaxID=67302 RepID=A0A919ALH6_9ACTN|nr:ATP-binding cassette domain-containing protein [Streptomyces fumanus]GHF15652.1 ABC transporter ATP-binding protein [Streptomyces fumanus]
MTPPPGPGAGALRRIAPRARRFLAGRKGVLARLGLWSLAEAGQTFVVGYGVAHSVDQGFLAGDTRRGLLWLGVAAAAVLLGAPVIRGVFAELAGLTEPLRDGLVRRAVDRSLDQALHGPGGTDRAAVSRLTNQVEIARDSFAGLVLTLRSFVFTAAGALLGLLSLHPALLVVVLPPLTAGLALFLATLRRMAAAQRRALAADEELGDHAACTRAALRDLTACATGPEAARHGANLVAGAAAASRTLARWAAVRTAALGVSGQLPVLALLLAVPWLRDRGVTAGALLGAFTYLVQSLLPALHTLMTALGAAGARLLIVLDRITGPGDAATPADLKAPTPTAPSAGSPALPAVDHSGTGPAAPLAVELRNVTLAYGVGAEPVLDSLDLRIAPGEHLAVVGPSGIGKSTLTRLVAGTLAPSAGEVRVAGRPVTGLTAVERDALAKTLVLPAVDVGRPTAGPDGVPRRPHPSSHRLVVMPVRGHVGTPPRRLAVTVAHSRPGTPSRTPGPNRRAARRPVAARARRHAGTSRRSRRAMVRASWVSTGHGTRMPQSVQTGPSDGS